MTVSVIRRKLKLELKKEKEREGKRKPYKEDEEEEENKTKAAESAVKNIDLQETAISKVPQENIIRAPQSS